MSAPATGSALGASKSTPNCKHTNPAPPEPYDPVDPGYFVDDTSGTSLAALAAPGSLPQEPIEPGPLEYSKDGSEVVICPPDLQTTQQFLDLLHVAVFESSGMQDDDIKSLHNPGSEDDLVDPLLVLRSLRHFINEVHSSRDHYKTMHQIELLNNPTDEFLTFNQVKCWVRRLSGVISLEHNMCLNSCVAYTGLYKNRRPVRGVVALKTSLRLVPRNHKGVL